MDYILEYLKLVLQDGKDSYVFGFFLSEMSDASAWMTILGWILITGFLAFASDSFHPFHISTGIGMWFKKVSVFKVAVYSAITFSMMPFYRLFVRIVGGLTGADASVLTLDCIGNYINPLSICIVCLVITTVALEHGTRQAFCMGMCAFAIPALLTYYTLTPEHLAMYAIVFILSGTAAFLYDKYSMCVTYLIMSAVYVVSKLVIITTSGQVRLLTGDTFLEKMMQYLACMEMDMVMIAVIAFVLFQYGGSTIAEIKKNLMKNAAVMAVMVILIAISVVSGRTADVYAGEVDESSMLKQEIFTFGGSGSSNSEESAKNTVATSAASEYGALMNIKDFNATVFEEDKQELEETVREYIEGRNTFEIVDMYYNGGYLVTDNSNPKKPKYQFMMVYAVYLYCDTYSAQDTGDIVDGIFYFTTVIDNFKYKDVINWTTLNGNVGFFEISTSKTRGIQTFFCYTSDQTEKMKARAMDGMSEGSVLEVVGNMPE